MISSIFESLIVWATEESSGNIVYVIYVIDLPFPKCATTKVVMIKEGNGNSRLDGPS